MLLNKKFRGPLYEADKGAGGGDGGVDLSSPEVQEAIKSAIDKEVSGLKNKNTELLGNHQKLREQLEKFKDVDPEKYGELVKAQEELETKKAEDKGEFDKLKQQILEKHGEKEKGWKERESFLIGQLENNLVTAELTKAIVAKKGSPDLLLHALRKNVKVVEEDGRIVAKVVDENGTPRIASEKGDPLGMDALVEEYYNNPVYQRAFDPSGTSGSGAPAGGGSGTGGAKTISREAWSKLEGSEFNAMQEKIQKGEVKVTN